MTRARRGEPAYACRDAITQLGAIAGVASLIAIGTLALLISPDWLRHLYTKDVQFIVVLLLPGLAFVFWSNRAFSKYSQTPEAADLYKSPSAVRVTNLLYILVPVVSILLFAFALRALSPSSTH